MVYIGPGPREIRQKLLDIALGHQPPFRSAYRNLNQGWNNIYVGPLLNQRDIEEMDVDDLMAKFKTEWEKFINGPLKEMDEVLHQYDWIWEDARPSQFGEIA